MGKNARRISVAGFVLAASLVLAFPGISVAAGTAPVITGSCQDTLQGKTAKDASALGLTLDAGAALNAPGTLTVGLDSAPAATGPAKKAPLVTLPVGDVVKSLGVGTAPVAGDLATSTVCPAVQGAANGVGDATQGLIKGAEPFVPPETPPSNPPQDPGVPPAPQPGSPNPGNHTGPIQTVPGDSTPGSNAIAGIFIGGALLPGNLAAPVIIPIVPLGQGPNVGQDGGGSPVIADRARTAQALPASSPQARLPLLLAVLLLAVVAAALVRTWIRRKPA
jgi:hypothetical protein